MRRAAPNAPMPRVSAVGAAVPPKGAVAFAEAVRELRCITLKLPAHRHTGRKPVQHVSAGHQDAAMQPRQIEQSRTAFALANI
jgi:hypothetical protein